MGLGRKGARIYSFPEAIARIVKALKESERNGKPLEGSTQREVTV